MLLTKLVTYLSRKTQTAPAVVGLFLALTIPAHAQNLGNGAVFKEVSLPGQNGIESVNFSLYGGGPAIGHIGNGFDYKDAADQGPFSLDYSGVGCPKECSFNGNFTTWFAPVAVDKYCAIQSGILSGTLFYGGLYHSDLTAEYSQIYCYQAGQFWYAAGGLTVHLHG
jgi:hypothetical protein